MTIEVHRNSRRRGFSLIELMVVLVLIGIMTALIIPQMKGTYEEALLRSTGRTLVDVFNLASSHAITLNQLHRVRIDRKLSRYRVEKPVQAGGSGSGFVSAPEIPGGEGAIDSRIEIKIQPAGDAQADPSEQGPPADPGNDPRKPTDDQSIAFYPDGTADGAEILLRDRDGFRLALRINPVTARVRIIELERK